MWIDCERKSIQGTAMVKAWGWVLFQRKEHSEGRAEKESGEEVKDKG